MELEINHLEKLVTYKEVVVCDTGQLSFSRCGHCGNSIDESKSYHRCPECDYGFGDVRATAYIGKVEDFQE